MEIREIGGSVSAPGSPQATLVAREHTAPAPPPRRPRRSAQYLLEGQGFTALRVVVDLLTAVLATISARVGADAAGITVDGGLLLFAMPPLTLAMLQARGMYKRHVRVVILDGVAPVVGAISVAAMILLSIDVLAAGATSELIVVRVWVFTAIYVGAGRIMLALVQSWARRRRGIGKPTLIVGAGTVGTQVARRLREHPEFGLRPVGFLDADPPPGDGVEERPIPVLGAPRDVEAISAAVGAEHVVLAFSLAPDRGLLALTRRCEGIGLEVSLVPRLFESITNRVALDRIGGLPLLGLRSVDPQGWQFAVKYALDRVLAAVALALLSPLLAAVVIAMRLESRGPTLFHQRRVGRDGTQFDLLKFRSMREAAPSEGGFDPERGAAPGGVEGVDRRTRMGRFLRRSSLDELPQLLNVVRGEMSLIGPRPERPEFVALFDRDLDRYADRHRVRSGITGWAQVHGLRGQTSLADRVEWDNFYIENWSLWLDVKVVLLTFGALLRGGE